MIQIKKFHLIISLKVANKPDADKCACCMNPKEGKSVLASTGILNAPAEKNPGSFLFF